MSIGNYFKKKWGRDKEVPAQEQFYSPLRIGLHSTIYVNTVDLLLMVDQLNPYYKLPSGDMSVNAIGTFTLEGNKVYQVYTEDPDGEEFILRIVEEEDFHTGDPKVAEVNLFKQVFTVTPETQASLERVLGDIGFLQIEVEGKTYDRLWGDQYTEKLDFRILNETVVTPRSTDTYVDNYILYGRTVNNVLGDDLTESLIVGIEEDDDRAQVIMQAGLSININDIEIR